MNNAYKRLALKLDELPNGYPETKSGAELKILKKLFTIEEAELASFLKAHPQSIQEIALAAKIPEAETKAKLVGMVKKGLIELKREEGKGLVFSLIPFVVGFYERQNAKIDQEFAELFEEYYQESFHKVMTISPSVHRVIPVEKAIPVNIDVMPYEKASTYLNGANSWGVLNCICRVQKKLIGQGCDHPLENCLVFSSKPNAFDRTDDIRALTKEEALQILDEANKAGLVHSTNNAQEDVNYICNCCTCSCGILRGIAEKGCLNSIASSDFYVFVNEEQCTGCEACIERCQFHALSLVDGIIKADLKFCVGCGLCVSSCPVEALSLIQKEDLISPPQNEEEWRILRSQGRSN